MSYTEKMQSYLRMMIRDILTSVEQNGLSGDQHFYISFTLAFPGVIVPDHKKHNREIAIVLKDDFKNLSVFEKCFSVTVSFDDQESRIVVPFGAIISFVDPSKNFVLSLNPIPEHRERKTNVIEFNSHRRT